MSKFSQSQVQLDVSPGSQRSSDPIDTDRPFRILILGDFTGRANRKVRSALAGRRPVLVDRDNADEVMANMHPRLQLPGLDLSFRDIDDFHPDHIYAEADPFQKLAEERHRPVAAPVSPARESLQRPAGSLLDAMLDESGEEEAAKVPDDAGDLAGFLKRVTAPHLVPREDPRQKEQASRADSAAAAAMRAVLHHPDFQSLEAAWRAVLLLVKGLETGEELKLYLFDATLDELAGDPDGAESLLTDREKSWAVIVGDYIFEQTAPYVKALGRLGRAARASGAPFIAEGAPPSELEPGPEWEALRRSPEAHWIGLTLPRFLLRLPYGPNTSPVESFEFEEMPETVHRQYLWGNPAFCCAYLLGQSFLEDGWRMRPGSHRRMDGVPLHVYTADGEAHMKPCAEILMTEKEADFLMQRGIMPLASMKEQDAVLLVRIQSIAEPLAALSGPWTA